MKQIFWLLALILTSGGQLMATGKEVVKTIVMPDPLTGITLPIQIVYNPVANKYYVTSLYGNALMVLDGTTHQKLNKIPAFTSPGHLFLNAPKNKVYGTYTGDSSGLMVFNCATDQLVKHIPCSMGNELIMTADETGNTIYYSDWWKHYIYIVDAANDVLADSIPISGTAKKIAYNPVDKKLYATIDAYPANDSVVIINTLNKQIIKTLSVSANSSTLFYNAQANKVLVLNPDDQNITVLDGAGDTVSTTISGLPTDPADITAGYNLQEIYVAYSSSSAPQIVVIDATTSAVKTTMPVSYFPWMLYYDSVQHKLFCANMYIDAVDIFNCNTHTFIDSVASGGQSYWIAGNALAGEVLCVNYSGNGLTAIDAQTNAVKENILLSIRPNGMLLNTAEKKLLVDDDDSPVLMEVDALSGAPIQQHSLCDKTQLMVYNTSNNKVYLRCVVNKSVLVMNGSTSAIEKEIKLTYAPGNMFINPVNGLLYVTKSGSQNGIYLINCATNEVQDSITTGVAPNSYTYNPENGSIYAPAGYFTIYRIIASTNALASTISFSYPGAIICNQANHKYYVHNYHDDLLTVYSSPTNILQSTINVGEAIQFLLDTTENTMWVLTNSSSRVKILDLATETFIDSFSMISPPEDGIFDEDRREMYFLHFFSDKLSVVDVNTKSVKQYVQVGNGPISQLYNKADTLLYVANRDGSSVSVVADSGRLLPSKVGYLSPLASQLTIFPNPTSQFTIIDLQLTMPMATGTIQLTDLTGTMVVSVNVGQLQIGRQQFELPLAGVLPGVYMVSVIGNDKLVGTGRVVVIR